MNELEIFSNPTVLGLFTALLQDPETSQVGQRLVSILWAVGGFFLVLIPTVLIHELGHFVAARLSNIRVEEFGLGLPPRALTITERNGTIYSLNWIPLGGFVRPAGEDDPSVPGGLAAASKSARFFVLSAGAGANFILAFLVFLIAYMVGPTVFDGNRVAVADVFTDTPAQEAGLQPYDTIISVNGVIVGGDTEIVQEQVRLAGTNPVEMVIERDGQQLTLMITPRIAEGSDTPMIGIQLGNPPTEERASVGFVESAVSSAQSMWDIVSITVRVPAMLIRGEISPSDARPVSIVGISQISGQAVETSASHGNPFPILNMLAFINVALGFTNLLPIPALDGGRILFVLVEAIRGRRIPPEREGMVHIVGMVLLLCLMVLMIVQDLVNPIVPF